MLCDLCYGKGETGGMRCQRCRGSGHAAAAEPRCSACGRTGTEYRREFESGIYVNNKYVCGACGGRGKQ